MNRFVSIILMILIIASGLTSCSKNTFQVRKNYHPRIKVEANRDSKVEEQSVVKNQLAIKTIPLQTKSSIPEKQQQVKIKKQKESILEKMANVFIPKKKELLQPVFHPEKKHLYKSTEGDDRTTGLIINLLALAFGIAALLMIIGMVHGNVWVYFVVGLVLAAAAIIMGFIGKGMAWKGFGWLAGIVGIIAVVLLLIFVLLVTVVHVTF